MDHEYAKQLLKMKYDGEYTNMFFEKYKDILKNVRTSKRACFIVINILGDNIETAKFISEQYDIFYNGMCEKNCGNCKYNENSLKNKV